MARAKKGSKKASTRRRAPRRRKATLGIPLKALMDLKPCDDGLAEALEYFKSKRAVRGAPRGFWAQVKKLNDYHLFSGDREAARRKIREMQDGVFLEFKPEIFLEKLAEGDYDFEDYTQRLLKDRGRTTWRRRVYDLVKDDIAKMKFKDAETDLKGAEEHLERLHAEIKELKAAMEGKFTAPKISEFNPQELFDFDDFSGNDHLEEEKRLARVSAEQLVAVIGEQLQTAIKARKR